MLCLRCGKEYKNRENFCNKCSSALTLPGINGGVSKKADPGFVSLICYLLVGLPGIYFYFFEKENRFIRFHALQSLLTLGAVLSLILVLRFISWVSAHFVSSVTGVPSGEQLSALFGMVYTFLMLAVLILWMFLMLKAYQGEIYKLPLIGDIADEYSGEPHP